MTINHAIRAIAFSSALALIVTALPTASAQSPMLTDNGSETGMGTIQNGLFLNGKESYRVVDTAGFKTAADVGATEPGSIAQVEYGAGCSSCGTACGGSCGAISSSACDAGFCETGFCGTGVCGTGTCGTSTCGTGGCGTGGCGTYGQGYGAFRDPCECCDPFCYVSIEALYMDNDTVGGFSLSPNFLLGNFDNELGGRITIGSAPDCIHGCEFTYTGNIEWDRRGSIAIEDPDNNPNRLGTFLRPAPGFDGNDLSSFGDMFEFDANNIIVPPPFPFPEVIPTATAQRQVYDAKYWSVEVNRTMWAGNYAKLLYGVRYIDYEELYAFDSLSPGVGANGEDHAGRLLVATDNDLYGFQVGMDLFFPICCNGFVDTRYRLGGFLNQSRARGFLRNAVGTPDEVFIGIGDDKNALAGVAEFGAGVRYQLGEMLSIRAGTEVWYLSQVASANRQFRREIGPRLGRSVRSGSDILMTGVSLGAELRY